MRPNKEIEALVHLLEDPDDYIYKEIRQKILDLGMDIVPQLELAWELNPFGESYQQRLESLISEIQFSDIKTNLTEWKSKSENNLLTGILLVNKLHFPHLNADLIEDQIEQIKRDITFEMLASYSPLHKVKIINHILFDIHGFKGDKTNYHAPMNSYFNQMMDRRKGNPLLLSVLYIEIACRLNIPIKGVNLPNHFVVGYEDANHDTGIGFYINPFSEGTIFYHDEVENFLKQLKLAPEAKYFEGCSNIEIVKRLIANLIYSYSKEEKNDKLMDLKTLIDLLQDSGS